MKSVRIYKDDIRTHVLRSLFFTDTVLVVAGALAITVLLYILFTYVLHFFNWGYFISSLIVSNIFFIAFITQKIDNQAIYKVVPRALKYKTSKKDQRYAELEDYFIDFTIQDNLIVRGSSIIGMYEIEPFDVALLNDQDREHFFVKLKQAIHVLPSQVQFIVKKQQAKSSDYSPHYFSLYDGSNTKREPLIAQYIEDLTNLVTANNFMITKHYAVFSVPCNATKPHALVAGVKKLNDLGMRFASALSAANITVRPLENLELKQFAQGTLR